ncbi:type II secretion system protein M [Sphingomonas gilva]|uniref:Type II secretion system protein M n=1 Tax=Sphingomonas gilva TaxID=2305907 RepID=A0A396S0T0_9SPHN|nr:type II secretion system protein GspM [Sphingomonas gilva]RHW16965.1 type II secretion system protein M [Sphingomonas gilva]
MTANLKSWFAGRTKRERYMLLVMGALMAIVIVWLGIVLPVNDALAAAKRRHAEALETEATIARQVGAIRSLRDDAVRLPAPLAEVVTQSAAEAGFTGAQVSAVGSDAVDVAIPAARPQALFAWIDGLRGRGIFPVSLAMRAGSGQTVSAEMRLKGRGV